MAKTHNTRADQLAATRDALSLTDEAIQAQVAAALQEDVGPGDVTAALLDERKIVNASIISREPATVCGGPWLEAVFLALDPEMQIRWLHSEGDVVNAGGEVCKISGSVRSLLSGERTALNFLQTLSGTATTTRRYVDAVAGTHVQLLDTRKTLPGLRLAQKYAVVCGGGQNHRLGLYDMILIKENHIAAAGSIPSALKRARSLPSSRTGKQADELGIEIEIENLSQLEQALNAGANRILLDNMNLADLREAVNLAAGRAQLEASGNVTLENIRKIAETGVEFISVGSLTKHLHAVDFSLRLNPPS